MAEESHHANVNVPKAMVSSVVLNGALSFIIVFIFLYFAGPLQAVVASGAQYPFLNIIHNATQSKTATAALVGFIIFMNFAATVAAISASGRMVWSFARDRGVPLWRQIQKVLSCAHACRSRF